MKGSRARTGSNFDEAFEVDVDTGDKLYSFVDKAQTRLSELGINPPEIPTMEDEHVVIFDDYQGMRIGAGDRFDGRFPTVIRRLSLDQLSALQSLFTSWYKYIAYQSELLASQKSEADKRRGLRQARLRNTLSMDKEGNKRTDQQRTNAAKYDRRFIEADADYEELAAADRILKAILKGAEQDLKTISREITVNQALQEQEANKARYGKRSGGRFERENNQAVKGSFNRYRKPDK